MPTITTLDLRDSEAVVMAADTAGIDLDSDLRRDYSGRFMYGDECFGIVGGPGEFAEFIALIASDEADGCATEGLAKRLADAVKTDSMGLSTIYYFPGYLLAD